jgi:2-phosphosulfolactate phosphatase
MQIEVTDFVAGAERARGVAIVIDVFRACSVIAQASAQGAARVLPVAGVEEALAFKAQHPEWLCSGERFGRKLDDFDAGNSPTELAQFDLHGRTVIHTTHGGTQGLTVAALTADAVFTGALVKVAATVTAVRLSAPQVVTLVRMGHQARERCMEDDLCADALVEGLTTGCVSLSRERAEDRLRGAPAAEKFFDPDATWAPEQNFAACTSVDRFDFAVRWFRDIDGLGAQR